MRKIDASRTSAVAIWSTEATSPLRWAARCVTTRRCLFASPCHHDLDARLRRWTGSGVTRGPSCWPPPAVELDPPQADSECRLSNDDLGRPVARFPERFADSRPPPLCYVAASLIEIDMLSEPARAAPGVHHVRGAPLYHPRFDSISRGGALDRSSATRHATRGPLRDRARAYFGSGVARGVRDAAPSPAWLLRQGPAPALAISPPRGGWAAFSARSRWAGYRQTKETSHCPPLDYFHSASTGSHSRKLTTQCAASSSSRPHSTCCWHDTPRDARSMPPHRDSALPAVRGEACLRLR